MSVESDDADSIARFARYKEFCAKTLRCPHFELLFASAESEILALAAHVAIDTENDTNLCTHTPA
jgi:hypothetical protein